MGSNSIVIKVAGIAVLLVGAGLVIFIGHNSQPEPPGKITTITVPAIHTADWYVAHPDVLKEDEHKCAGDASSMSAAACQNASSADARLSVIEMRNAAASNGSSVSSSQSPKSSQ